jgi:hypothetical protein
MHVVDDALDLVAAAIWTANLTVLVVVSKRLANGELLMTCFALIVVFGHGNPLLVTCAWRRSTNTFRPRLAQVFARSVPR